MFYRSRKPTKAESKMREASFKEWLPTIDQRIDQWKQAIPMDLANKLDKSPESLITLEKYLNDTFPEASYFYDIKNALTFEAIAAYIGEVYRLNLPGDLIWKCGNGEIVEKKEPEFAFFYEVGLRSSSWSENPTEFIPFILHSKPGNKLFDYFKTGLTNGLIEFIKAEEIRKNEIPIPGRGGYSYQHFILLQNETYSLKDLESTLQNYYAKPAQAPKIYLANNVRLVIEFTKDFCFHFWYDNKPGVLIESQEIAQDYKGDKKNKAAIAACKHRIEFWGDSDPKGEYFNEHLFVLSHIVKIPGVFVYDFKLGIFYDENG